MNKLFYFLFLLTTVSHAQISILNKNTNDNITNNEIVTITENNYATYFIVTNNYSYDINISLQILKITNTDGKELNVCFSIGSEGNCYYPVNEGEIFTSEASLTSGESTKDNDIELMHIEGGNGANFTTYPKDYLIKISALNTSDNSEISSITFTYRYNPDNTLINQFNNDDFLQISVSYGELNINSKYTAKLNIYNLTGQKIKEANIDKGKTIINTNNFTKGIYIIRAISGNKEIYQRVIIN